QPPPFGAARRGRAPVHRRQGCRSRTDARRRVRFRPTQGGARPPARHAGQPPGRDLYPRHRPRDDLEHTQALTVHTPEGPRGGNPGAALLVPMNLLQRYVGGSFLSAFILGMLVLTFVLSVGLLVKAMELVVRG